jgi:hypothetical protein
MPIFETLSITLLAALGWLWFDSVRARDIAIGAARSACAADGVQLLDDTVAIAGLKPARDDDGRFVLRRAYAFEFSVAGNDRRPGSIVLLGQQVMFVNVGLRLTQP